MLGGQTSCDFEVIWLEIVELLHASPAEEEVVGLLLVVELLGMVDLAQSVASPDVDVVLVNFRVDFVL